MSKIEIDLDDRMIAFPRHLKSDGIYRGYIVRFYDGSLSNLIFEHCVIIVNVWDFKNTALVSSNCFFDCLIVFGGSVADLQHCEAKLKKANIVRNCQIRHYHENESCIGLFPSCADEKWDLSVHGYKTCAESCKKLNKEIRLFFQKNDIAKNLTL